MFVERAGIYGFSALSPYFRNSSVKRRRDGLGIEFAFELW